MSSLLVPKVPSAGFNFENCQRNANMESQGFSMPKTFKTGTTIAGIIYEGGVILGADTRATEDHIVADKNCSKIHFLAKNMYAGAAGVAADAMMTTQKIASQLELHRLHMGRTVPVVTAATLLKRLLFRYQGQISAAFVLGGVDRSGPHIYCIYPHGNVDELPFATMGSGMLAAMSVFELRWKNGMTEVDGKRLVRDAIVAGICNDNGSGSNVDLCIIPINGPVQYIRPYEEIGVKGELQGSYRYARGTTKTVKSKVIPLIVESMFISRMNQPGTSASVPMEPMEM